MANKKELFREQLTRGKQKIKNLREQADRAIQTGQSGDANMAAYLKYREKYNELVTKYPGWDKLVEPIDYTRFVLDYNESIYDSIRSSDAMLKGLTSPEVYALKMHGINESAIEKLREKLIDLDTPENKQKWLDLNYFEGHIAEAYARLRELIPNDEEYDQVFSPKEEVLIF